MRRESRGEERLLSFCGDGDIVDVGEGDGGGFGEGGKLRRSGGAASWMQICKCVEMDCSARAGSPYCTMGTHDPESQRAYFPVRIQKSIVKN